MRPIVHMTAAAWASLPAEERHEERLGDAVVRWWRADDGPELLVHLTDPPEAERRPSAADLDGLETRLLGEAP